MRRFVAAAAAVTMSAALTGALQASPAGAADKSDTADTSSTAAKQALVNAKSVMAPKSRTTARQVNEAGGGDATMALNRLMRVRDDLSSADRRVADALLARPTDPSGGGVGESYEVPEATPLCGPTVCVHYVTSTADAPPLADGNGNGVPDSVEDALATAEHVNGTYVSSGYRRPKGDGPLGGGNNLVDVYLVNIGTQGLYGYCTSDEPNPPAGGPYDAWAYCAIDNDFSAAEFGTSNTPTENQQVTLAHEYYHAVQYAYDSWEDPWLMEATATWAEDELYDSVDDNRQYLPAGQLGDPSKPLDMFSSDGSMQYGNWIFFRYLTERYTARTGAMPNLPLQVWRKVDGSAGGPDQSSMQAVVNTLKQRKATWRNIYVAFADANRRPAKTYSEGADYKIPGPRQTSTLTRAKRATPWKSTRTKHLTSYTVRVKPGAGLGGAWRLRTHVNLGSLPTGSMARISTYMKSGKVSSRTLRVDRTGAGQSVTTFDRNKVKYVELTITNGSLRTSCWTDQSGPEWFACQGTPKDDAVKQAWKFNAIPTRLGS